MTLSEFEQKCLYGHIGSVFPVDELMALKRVQELAVIYQNRMEKHIDCWKQPAKICRKKGGIENSLPNGDRE